MTTSNMKIKLEIQDFENQSDSIKSLINFIVENGSFYFLGHYDDQQTPNRLLHMSGVVRLNSRNVCVSYSDMDDYNYSSLGYDTFIVYSQQYNSSIQNDPWNPSSLPDQGDSIIEGHYEEGIYDCNTVLCQATTSLCAYDIISANVLEDTIEKAQKINGSFDIPVTITPYINNTINTDANQRPISLVTKPEEEPYVYSVPIVIGQQNISYDIQLRTPSFTIQYEDETHNYVFNDVFYKIGVCALDGDDNKKQQIIDVLKQQAMEVSGGNSSGYGISRLSLLRLPYSETYYNIHKDSGNFVTVLQCGKEEYSGYLKYILPVFMILPLIDNNETLQGFAYLKLCNTDGTTFNKDIPYGDFDLYGKTSEDGEPIDQEGSVYLAFIDSDLDGGFIPLIITDENINVN